MVRKLIFNLTNILFTQGFWIRYLIKQILFHLFCIGHDRIGLFFFFLFPDLIGNGNIFIGLSSIRQLMTEFNLFYYSAIILTHNICSILVLQLFRINEAFAHHLAHLLWEKVVLFMEFVNLILIIFQRDFGSVEVWKKFIKLLIVSNLILLIKFRESQLDLLGVFQLLINSSSKQIRVIPQNFSKVVVKVFDRFFAVFDILGGPNK